jgi:FkbM family methyltransferase
MIFTIARKIKRKLVGYDKVLDQLESLKKMPRYTQGDFVYNQKTLTFPDAFSFVAIFSELFYKEAYRFKSRTDEPVIIDCGANIGLSAIFFKQLYPKARIVAFEPDKEIFGYLQSNLNACGHKDVELHNTGVWKEEGILRFKNEGADGGRISFDYDQSEFRKVIEIKTVKLSNYINKTVDFLKIDIEGAETEVLQEIEPKLHLVEHLFIEYHSFVNSEQTLDRILSLLTRSGFEYYLDIPCILRNQPFIEDGSFLSYNLLVNIYAQRK